MIKKPLAIPFLITLIFSTFSPLTIHSAKAATVGTAPCIATVSSETGVTATSFGNYCVVSFTSTAATTTWSVPTGVTSADVLVVGGGGAGGAGIGGGGGAGQFINSTTVSVSGTITVSVGAGGTGTTRAGNAGSSSVFGSITAAGGGGGGFNDVTAPTASSNGSGGGGGFSVSGSSTTGAAGTANSGGTGSSGTCSQATGGGGGGAGGVGGNGTLSNGGAGGAGSSSSITGSSVTYAGGGGGGINADPAGCTTTGSAGSGGSGVGGAGGTKVSPYGGNTGTANTGGGGGGGSNTVASATGGGGGSGIVVVNFLKPITITITTITNKLSSRSFDTATATVSSGSLSYSSSGACSVNSSSGLITFTSTGNCTITATAASSPNPTASTTFEIVPNLTQRIISRTGVQPNSLSSFIPPPYLTTARSESTYACLDIVDASGASVLSSPNLNISLNSISGAAMTSLNSSKSYTINGTLAQVQTALSTLKINSTSGRIMAANSGSIYLRVRANLIADATTDAKCLDIGNDGRIALYQYTSDQIRRKNVPQKSGSTP